MLIVETGFFGGAAAATAGFCVTATDGGSIVAKGFPAPVTESKEGAFELTGAADASLDRAVDFSGKIFDITLSISSCAFFNAMTRAISSLCALFSWANMA
jgi:hypothetical protein